MYDECWSLIFRCRFVDGQVESCTDILPSELHPSKSFDILTGIEWVILSPHGVASYGIIAQYGGRSHQ